MRQQEFVIEREPDPTEKNDVLCGYVCYFNGRRFECRAETLYKAKMQAVAYFKPRSNQVHKISVTLAEKGNKPVVHTADF